MVGPHIFDCQTDRKRASTVPNRSLLVKRQRKQLVHEAVAESDRNQHNMLLITHNDEPCASTSAQLPEIDCHYTTDDSLMPAIVDPSEVLLQTENVGIQTKQHFRSKLVLCNITSSMQNTDTSPVRSMFAEDASTSPIKMPPNAGRMIFSRRNSSSSSNAEVESSSFVPNSDSDYEDDYFPQDIKREQL
ncbi:hypothetical protein JTB14_033899 [Gonioctena quinquepunctata]|nr:hypothetical protein JTB14_033899 [Gonioctena quinquepunctata]